MNTSSTQHRGTRRICRHRATRDLDNRYYDPTMGQFISDDPLVGATGQPYSFANNNPINASDPSGLHVDCGQGNQDCQGLSGCQMSGMCGNPSPTGTCGCGAPPTNYQSPVVSWSGPSADQLAAELGGWLNAQFEESAVGQAFVAAFNAAGTPPMQLDATSQATSVTLPSPAQTLERHAATVQFGADIAQVGFCPFPETVVGAVGCGAARITSISSGATVVTAACSNAIQISTLGNAIDCGGNAAVYFGTFGEGSLETVKVGASLVWNWATNYAPWRHW